MKALLSVILLGSALILAGCGRKAPEGAAAETTHIHKDVPPHGGTVVALGDDYNLELVRDGDAGTLSAYVLDDEMEEFIRVRDPAITIVAQAGGQDQTLVLAAVANSATGETVGDTSLFQVQADWLKRTPKFSGTLQRITIRGTPFATVHFDFPAGSAKE